MKEYQVGSVGLILAKKPLFLLINLPHRKSVFQDLGKSYW